MRGLIELGKGAAMAGASVLGGLGLGAATGGLGTLGTSALAAGTGHGFKRMLKGAKDIYRGFMGQAVSDRDASRFAQKLNEWDGRMSQMPQEEVQMYHEALVKYEGLQKAGREIPYVNVDKLQKQYTTRLLNPQRAQAVEDADERRRQEKTGTRRVKTFGRRIEDDYPPDLSPAEKEAIGKQQQEKKAQLTSEQEQAFRSLADQPGPHASPVLTRIAKSRLKGLTPRSTARRMQAMRSEMERMQRSGGGSASDPDRPTRGGPSEIPSQDMSSGDMSSASIEPKGQSDQPNAHEPYMEEVRKKRVSFRTKPTPAGSRDRFDSRAGLNLRGGGRPDPSPRRTMPQPKPSEEGGVEREGPNTGVENWEIMDDMQRLRSQVQWLVNNPNGQGDEETRNLTQLASRYKKLGGDMNALLRGGGDESATVSEGTDAGQQPGPQPGPQRGTQTQPQPRARRGRGGQPRGAGDPRALYQQMAQLAASGVRQPQQPVRTQTIIPIPIPTGQQLKKKPTPTIVVKQTVKQEQRASVKRSRRIRKIQTGSITKARKAYNVLKKQIKAALQKDKTSEYARGNDKIKKMPVKSRKGARAKLRAEIKAKLQNLLKMAKPSTAYKTIESITRAIAQLKKLKW
jgi:hypothetical protein